SGASKAQAVATAPALQPSAKATARSRKPETTLSPRLCTKQRRSPLIRRDVEVEGLTIHAAERRTGSAGRDTATTPAIVLIHGAGLDHRDWTFSFLEQLPKGVRVLAFDRPGFGGSERPSISGALPRTQARLLRQAASKLGVERAIVVGHSWGGAVATAWALDAPEQTAGVVSLAGAVLPWSLASSVEHSRRIRNAARQAMLPGGVTQAAMEAMAESFDPAPIPQGYVEHVRSDLSIYSSATMATAADVSTVNGALGIQAQRYAALRSPVELVYGGADRILSPDEQGVAAQKAMPTTRLTVVDDAGHMLHHTHPDVCVAAIERLYVQAVPPKPKRTRKRAA
ncbi:MAG: alpha/beta hydrolase, partial [Pseudomonadota bacterium]